MVHESLSGQVDCGTASVCRSKEGAEPEGKVYVTTLTYCCELWLLNERLTSRGVDDYWGRGHLNHHNSKFCS